MQNEKNQSPSEQAKPKKSKGKIAQVYKLHQKGLKTKEIAEKMKLSERVVRAYVWRASHPKEYQKLLKRYFDKRKQKAGQSSDKPTPKTEKTETA